MPIFDIYELSALHKSLQPMVQRIERANSPRNQQTGASTAGLNVRSSRPILAAMRINDIELLKKDLEDIRSRHHDVRKDVAKSRQMISDSYELLRLINKMIEQDRIGWRL
jgi:hypothetical protein